MTQPTPNPIEHGGAPAANLRPARQTNGHAGNVRAFTPPDLPKLERIGLGWIGKFPGDITIKLARMKEQSGDFSAEIIVTAKQSGATDGIIEWGRINLMAQRTRSDIAKRIDGRVPGPDWGAIIDLFCFEVIRRERSGEPLERTNPDEQPQPLRYLLAPMLPFGLPTLLYGEGGNGKSTIAAGIAVTLETGAVVFPGWEPPYTAPVLILDWEATKQVWQSRLNAVANGVGVTPPSVAYLPCRRKLSDDAERIGEAVYKSSAALVVVDAVNQAFGVAHQDADPAEAAFKAFATIREMSGTDVTWLLIDHVTGLAMHESVTGGTPLKAYGSIAKQWLARQQFYLAAERDVRGNRQELVLKHTKANYTGYLEPIPMAIVRGEKGIRFEFPHGIASPELAGQLTLPQRIEELLRTEGALSPERIRKLLGMDARKVDRDKVWVNLSRMQKYGSVTRFEDGRFDLGGYAEQADAEMAEDEQAPVVDPS